MPRLDEFIVGDAVELVNVSEILDGVKRAFGLAKDDIGLRKPIDFVLEAQNPSALCGRDRVEVEETGVVGGTVGVTAVSDIENKRKAVAFWTILLLLLMVLM